MSPGTIAARAEPPPVRAAVCGEVLVVTARDFGERGAPE